MESQDVFLRLETLDANILSELKVFLEALGGHLLIPRDIEASREKARFCIREASGRRKREIEKYREHHGAPSARIQPPRLIGEQLRFFRDYASMPNKSTLSLLDGATSAFFLKRSAKIGKEVGIDFPGKRGMVTIDWDKVTDLFRLFGRTTPPQYTDPVKTLQDNRQKTMVDIAATRSRRQVSKEKPRIWSKPKTPAPPRRSRGWCKSLRGSMGSVVR